MNKAIVVASSIQAREGRFTYSNTRSFFNSEERYRQTFASIISLVNCVPDAKIFLVDSSDNFSQQIVNFSIVPNVEFVSIKNIAPDVCEIINTHHNKSYCESLLLNTFYRNFRRELQNYDYVIKATGRYMYRNFDSRYFNEDNLNKWFFKKHLKFEWDDKWNYHYVDNRPAQNDNKLRQYCTVLYGFGSHNLNKMIDINEATMHCIKYNHCWDIETLSYYLTRTFEKDVIETDWIVTGWDGVSGRFMYY